MLAAGTGASGDGSPSAGANATGGSAGTMSGAGGDGGNVNAGSGGAAGEVGTGGASGSAGVASDAGAGPCDGPLLPMAVGNSWTYRVTNPVDGVSMKTTTVESFGPLGGTGPNANEMAFHVVTSKVSGQVSDRTESWQGVLEDDTVVRYRELSFPAGTMQSDGEVSWDPYKLRISESAEQTVVGASWNETYTETEIKNGVPMASARSDGWSVDAVDVPCGPVDGEMLSCIRISKTADGSMAGKTYLFARCIGKVREEGTQVEELVEHTVN
jgi:hypothetical protein